MPKTFEEKRKKIFDDKNSCFEYFAGMLSKVK